MKSFKKMLVGLVVSGTLMAGCNKILDTKNPSYTTDDFFNTKQGVEKLLVDVYSKLRGHYNTAKIQYWGTDIYLAADDNPDARMFNAYDNTFNSTAGVVGGYWNNLYKMIQETNILLNRMKPEMEGLSAGEYTTMQAEAKFLRALAYYYLVETFGPVPLLIEESTTPITSVTRQPEADIYSFMIEELTAIEDHLPMKPTQTGRVGKGAVYQLLGKIYLTRAYRSYGSSSDFTTAAGYFDQLINDAGNTFTLLPNFASVFDENNQANREVIFSIQYTTDRNFVGGGNPLQSMFGFCINCFYPSMFIESQKDYSYMQREFWINPRVHELFDPSKDSRYEASFQRSFTINNPDHPRLGEPGLFMPVWNDGSGNTIGAEEFIPFKDNEGNYLWYPQLASNPELAKGSDKMPILKKFKDTKILWTGPGSREAVVYRLADTYLLSAEAHLGAGATNTALQRMNAIRRRAAVNDDLRDDMELSSIDLDILLDERARELLGEYDRWFDLKRTGKLIERTLANNPQAKATNNLSAIHLLRPHTAG
jgi:hypothetical protein